jgi:hypothetical protein
MTPQLTAWLRALVLVPVLMAAPVMADDEPIFDEGDWVIEAHGALTIRSDGGGNIHDYADFIATLSDTEVRITGVCKSSCTMFLSLPHACVAPGASLGFHGPSSKDVSIRNLLGLVDKIADHHPAEIAAQFRSDWGLSRDFTWLTGAEVLAMVPGLATCKEIGPTL